MKKNDNFCYKVQVLENNNSALEPVHIKYVYDFDVWEEAFQKACCLVAVERLFAPITKCIFVVRVCKGKHGNNVDYHYMLPNGVALVDPKICYDWVRANFA